MKTRNWSWNPDPFIVQYKYKYLNMNRKFNILLASFPAKGIAMNACFGETIHLYCIIYVLLPVRAMVTLRFRVVI
jgi:hypothetical protein